eukprot:11184548-Lingulodinium_polyedra.AAC.1
MSRRLSSTAILVFGATVQHRASPPSRGELSLTALTTLASEVGAACGPHVQAETSPTCAMAPNVPCRPPSLV